MACGVFASETLKILISTGLGPQSAHSRFSFRSPPPPPPNQIFPLRSTPRRSKMRQKRSKTYRKLLASYILHFGYRPPFQLLVDASFSLSLSALHLNADEANKRLSDVLQTSQMTKGKRKGFAETPDMKCMITQCCMVELYKAEKEGQLQKDAVQLAKTWERRKCNHREAIDGDECLKSVVGATNKHRYMLASDSRKLRAHLREEVAGIPLVHTNQSRVIVLEPMSDVTKKRIQEIESSKLGGSRASDSSEAAASLGDNVIVAESSEPALSQNGSGPSSSKTIVRGGNRPKAPNPLSNKKPKKVLEQERLEKEKRTQEIRERTEANRAKKRKAEEEAREDTTSSSLATKSQEEPQQRRDRKSSPARELDDDQTRKKRRKRGGRGAGGSKSNTTPATVDDERKKSP